MSERHQIIRKLGSGGFGSVYLAHDTKLDRDVALKRLDLNNDGACHKLSNQLLSEAKILAGLKHPSIVSVFDVIESDKGGDIIMEFIEGESLDKVVGSKPLSLESFCYISTQLLSAMESSHSHGVLHCDLKPANILLSKLDNENYHATVLDFGMSFKNSDKDVSEQELNNHSVVGSIHCMAPEVLDNQIPSAQSDLYSLGCLFYYMLTGKYPFDGDSSVLIMAAHMRNAFIPLKEVAPELPEALCQWVETHLSQEPSERFAKCQDSLRQLLSIEGIDALKHYAEVNMDQNLTESTLDAASSHTKTSIKLSKQQEAEFNRSKKGGPATAPMAAESTPLADRVEQQRPQNMWYFSIDGNRKGPVPFSKVCELIADGYIKEHDQIYQQRIGQWTPAKEIPEFKEEFQEAVVKPPRPPKKKKVALRNSQRIRAQKAAIKAAKVKVEMIEKPDSPIEIITLIGLGICVGAFLYLFPEMWQMTFSAAALGLVICGMIFSRMRMMADDTRWVLTSLILPVFTDIIYAIVSPQKGTQAVILQLLGFALFFYASSHRSPDDFLFATQLDFLSNLLSGNSPEWLDSLLQSHESP
ncbi:protein kinase domain-containing protein [Rubritalea marina]|uniref:protein kinase domain-containing protein n=1 Tax=Rubritalea marina TaxID=361055 RepID=UPI000372FC63|nr:protein kinase [Rubritalea marina]